MRSAGQFHGSELLKASLPLKALKKVEYRAHRSTRCEILARPTEWFIDNTKHRTVPGRFQEPLIAAKSSKELESFIASCGEKASSGWSGIFLSI